MLTVHIGAFNRIKYISGKIQNNKIQLNGNLTKWISRNAMESNDNRNESSEREKTVNDL